MYIIYLTTMPFIYHSTIYNMLNLQYVPYKNSLSYHSTIYNEYVQ